MKVDCIRENSTECGTGALAGLKPVRQDQIVFELWTEHRTGEGAGPTRGVLYSG